MGLLLKRVQLRRRKGWRKPEGAVVVSRPTKWGNPYDARRVGGRRRAAALFRRYLATSIDGRALAADARRELRGKDLACWCPLGEPCHADVLLEVANEGWRKPP